VSDYCAVCLGRGGHYPDCDLIRRPVERRDYCGNCWESLTNGAHRPDQPCTTPTAPLSYTELGVAIRESLS
jgi:hypothetical protein